MHEFTFYEAGGPGVHGWPRLLIPFRRLLRRLLRPVFERQALLFQQLHAEAEQLEQRIDLTRIRLYVAEHPNCYLGVGGLGDALLTIAVAHADPAAHIIFAANPLISPVAAKFFEAFDLPYVIVGFPRDKSAFWQLVSRHPHCASVGALPKDLNWDHEWVHHLDEYLPRLVTRMPLRERFGKVPNPRPTRGVIGLGPRSAWKGTYKRKDLSKDEYQRLVRKYLDADFTVFTFGSADDLSVYGAYPHDNALWYSTDFVIAGGKETPSDTRTLFAAINACEEVISVDTWLKSYSALAGIPTQVILSRNRSNDLHIYMNDSGDRIFLNPHVWPIRLVGLADLGIAGIPQVAA